jgi:hypothetical protein
LFCLSISMNVLAQSKDAGKVDTIPKIKAIYQLYEQIKTQPGTSDPLVMVDDSIYKGDIHNINSKDVASIDVIKGDDAKQIFGPKARNGAFMIKTKRNQGVIGPIHESTNDSVLYVQDGMPIPKELIRTDKILIKDVLTGKKLDELAFNHNKKLDSLIVIVTVQGATIAYQMKLSTFSKKYKDYLETHRYDDKDFLYVVDGVQVEGNRNNIIRTLYTIPSEKIKEIRFNQKQAANGSATLVIINTKQ